MGYCFRMLCLFCSLPHKQIQRVGLKIVSRKLSVFMLLVHLLIVYKMLFMIYEIFFLHFLKRHGFNKSVFSVIKYMSKEHNRQQIIVTIPGMRPFALCSGLLGLSRLERFRGSGVMFFVWGLHSSWLWCNVEVPTDPSERHRHRRQQRNEASETVGIAGQFTSAMAICHTHSFVWVAQTRCNRWGDL